MQTQGKYLGTYKVRKDWRGKEQVIHVPATVSGDYAIYLAPDGTMTFMPVGTV